MEYKKSRQNAKRVISSAKENKQKEWENDLNDSECQNEIFRRAKQMVKERQDITGLNCIKGESGKVIQSINQSIMFFRVVQVIKSLQDPLEVGNNLPGINDNVRERGLEQNVPYTDIWCNMV